MDVRIPLGTLLNPVRPAALSCRTHLLGRTLDLILGLIGQRQPRMMTAAGFSDSTPVAYFDNARLMLDQARICFTAGGAPMGRGSSCTRSALVVFLGGQSATDS
jgi:N-methylhydantoinase B/oxoprolinase/acetone carboxylase alpha subunit